HLGPPRCEPSPEHLITCPHRNHGVNLTSPEELLETPQHAGVAPPANQLRVSRNLLGQQFAERAALLEAAKLGNDAAAVEAADEIHEQGFRSSDRHRGGAKHDPQGAIDMRRMWHQTTCSACECRDLGKYVL